MGKWTMVISGEGAHHNTGFDGPLGLEQDADQRLLEIVHRLLLDGHRIEHAAILHGNGADVVQLAYRDGGLTATHYDRWDGTRQDAPALLQERRLRRGQAEGPAEAPVQREGQ